MVTPVSVNPFRREVLVDTGDRYEKGFSGSSRRRTSGRRATASRRASTSPKPRPRSPPRARRRSCGWSRFPFVVVDRTEAPPRVLLNDYRYSDAGARAGWAGLSLMIGD